MTDGLRNVILSKNMKQTQRQSSEALSAKNNEEPVHMNQRETYEKRKNNIKVWHSLRYCISPAACLDCILNKDQMLKKDTVRNVSVKNKMTLCMISC